MALVKTDYNLIYNDDGSLCVTIRKDDVPFEGVKSFAVETGTTNLFTDPQFLNVDENNAPLSWNPWKAYGNTILPTVYEEGGKRFCRLELDPYGSAEISQRLILNFGIDYTISYWARLISEDFNSTLYKGAYYYNLYYQPKNISFEADGTETIIITEGTIDYTKILPSSVEPLYKLYDNSNNFLGYVIDVDEANSAVILDRTVPTGSYTGASFQHIDDGVYYAFWNLGYLKIQNDWKWTYEIAPINIPEHYNEHGAYIETNITFRIYTASGSNIKATLDIYHPQLEAKPFATSFVDGTRQDGFLYFENLAPSVIAYWVKHLYLVGTHYYLTLTNPNDEAYNSLGIRTSNSVYKVRRQVDGVIYDNQIISTTTNVWNFHVLIFTGSTYELYINGEHQLSISEIPNGLNRVIIGNFTKTNPIFPADSLFANIYFGEYDPNIWTDEYIQELYNARKPFKVPEGAKFI